MKDTLDDRISLMKTLSEQGYSKLSSDKIIAQWEVDLEKNKDADIHLRLQFKESLLDMYCKWEQLNEDERRSLLWQLGMDTKAGNYYTEGVFERVAGGAGKLSWERVIFGNERTDKEWLSKTQCGVRLASFEAQTYERRKKDSGYDREMHILSGG